MLHYYWGICPLFPAGCFESPCYFWSTSRGPHLHIYILLLFSENNFYQFTFAFYCIICRVLNILLR